MSLNQEVAVFSILHISDLHRSKHEPIDNDTLIASLLADRDRYVTETPQVPLPNAIIISGDIIQGVGLGAPEHTTEIRAQYKIAEDFISRLADQMIEGNRSNVVIIPGNHDVSWNDARAAMREVPPEQEPKRIPEALFKPDERYRWSWEDRRIYEVADFDAYRRRLDEYWSFLERFYNGTPLAFPIDQTRGFNLFELDGGRIIVAAFESIHGNDCYSFQGCIRDGIVSKCALTIRDTGRQYRLRAAAWHHSVSGPPYRTDYMDIATVQEMIGNGFRIGFHGHQHSAEVASHYIHVPDAQAMAVVAAGSLCAGSRELPRGIDRQYNVIHIDDNYLSARIHVREMSAGNQFGRCNRGQMATEGSISLNWPQPADAVGRPIDFRNRETQQCILSAEQALKSGEAANAMTLLKSVDVSQGTYARALLTEAARSLKQWNKLTEILDPPSNADELVQLVEALINSRKYNYASSIIDLKSRQLNLAEHIRCDLKDKIDLAKIISGENS